MGVKCSVPEKIGLFRKIFVLELIPTDLKKKKNKQNDILFSKHLSSLPNSIIVKENQVFFIICRGRKYENDILFNLHFEIVF